MDKIEKSIRLIVDFFHDYYMGIIFGALLVSFFGILVQIIDATNLEPYLKDAPETAHTILNAIHNAIVVYWAANALLTILVFIGSLSFIWILSPKTRTRRKDE